MSNLIKKILARKVPAITNQTALTSFIDGSSAYVAQSTLYGYIKTRAGFEYFRLFDDKIFVNSINVAKWNIYAACVSDLTLFCGAHIRQQLQTSDNLLTVFMATCAESAFAEHGTPTDAGDDYVKLVQKALERVRTVYWLDLPADESPFSHSPDALVYWSPIADNHKKHDAAIVKNSITFKWKEIRDNFRHQANLPALANEILQQKT